MSDKKELPTGEMSMPGIRYNGNYWEEVTIDGMLDELDLEMIQSEPVVEEKLTCECGVDSIGYGDHSDYCPKGKKDGR